MKRRDAHNLLVVFGAVGGAGAGALVPADILELASRASGLAATLPAATPLLGDTARIVLLALAGLLAAGLVALTSPWGRRVSHKNSEDQHMTFMDSVLGGLFRRRARPAELADATPVAEPTIELPPVVRRADAHPDAPPRAPLMVSRDLGGEASLMIEEESRGPIVQDITGLAMPRAPEPLPWEAIESEMSRLLETVRFRAVEDDAQSDAAYAGADAAPSIRDLTARLERGIARRRATSTDDVPASLAQSSPPPPDRATVLAVVSAVAGKTAPDGQDREPGDYQPSDLEAALAALRTITARAC